MKTKNKIMLLASGYAFAKKIVAEYDNDEVKHNINSIIAYRRIMRTIEHCTNMLDENSRFIIENEVILGKKNNWYLDYLSSSTYYRHAKSAYINFLNIIDN